MITLVLTQAEVFAASDYVPITDDDNGYETPLGSDAGIAAGYYVIYPKCAPTRTLTVKNGSKNAGANIYTYHYVGKYKQWFEIIPNGDGTYIFKNRNSGKVMQTHNGSIINKANVEQGSYKKYAYQKWYIIKSGSYYVIQNAASSKVLTVQNAADNDKSNVMLYSNKKTDGQVFTLKLKRTTSSGSGSKTKKYKTSTRVWKDSKDLPIMANIIGAVESGGQVYGKRDYSAYSAPYANTGNEVTITLGWAQCYGAEAQKLVQMIYKMSPSKFKKIDTKKLIVNALKKNWVSTKWAPTAKEKQILIKLITSENGKKAQDQLFQESMKSYINACKSTYTNNAWAVHMYCEICHLGGGGAVKRIFDRCNGDYSLDSIMNALKKDQANGNGSEVGDQMFWSRHEKCCEFLQKYAA
jgi:hypothetical protein